MFGSNHLIIAFDRFEFGEFLVEMDFLNRSIQTICATKNGTQTTEALRQLTTPVHRKQKRRVTVSTGAVQEFADVCSAISIGCLIVTKADGIKNIVDQIGCKAFRRQILAECSI